MSEIINCDPSRGFVAFPVDLFDLDLSPGAFRTLAELCRMANVQGQCWPSLAQLGKRLGRSRASVSAYITELRDAGVLTTQKQRMANGYNYRLRYTVTFWKEWRSGLGQGQVRTTKTTAPRVNMATQQPERSVHPAERPLETQNHIHKNHCSVGSDEIALEKWKKCIGKAHYPAFENRPTEALLDASAKVISQTAPEAGLISADITTQLERFHQKHGLGAVDHTLAPALLPFVRTPNALEALMTKLEATWQAHWRNPPSLFQLRRLFDSVPPLASAGGEAKLLKSYLRRWKLYQQTLPSQALRPTVPSKQYPRI